MWIALGVAVVIVFFVMSQSGKAVHQERSFHALTLAKPFFQEHDINEDTVMFQTYSGRPYTLLEKAVSVAGTGKTNAGENIGFVIEVSPEYGVSSQHILVPHGIATWHKLASQRCAMSGHSLAVELTMMAEQHRAKLAAKA